MTLRVKNQSLATRYLLLIAGWLAAGLYAFQTWIAIHTLRSPMDEGGFIVKGLAFANGQYVPYQPDSFWLNKMPLAFLIPGWVLKFFEAGIVSTRYFAMVVSLLFLLGLFLLLRRESNTYLAIIGLWVFALNPILIKTLAMASSQGLAACILIWCFYFFFGKQRKDWQIASGAFLAAILVMTRENLLPVLIYMWVYVFVCYRKSFWMALLASLLPLITVHAIFFPNILINWFSWVPFDGIRAWLFRLFELDQVADHRFGKGDPMVFTRLTALMEGIRVNLFIFLGVWVAFFTFIEKKAKKRRFEVISLLILFLLLVLMHAWASIGKNYCIYCFQNYLSFFNALGLLLIAMAIYDNAWRPLKSPFWIVLTSLFIAVPAIIFSSYKDFYKTAIFEWLYENIWKYPLPRIKNLQMVGGTTSLKALFINFFGLDIDVALKVIFPVISLLFLIGLFICLAAVLFWWLQKPLTRHSPIIFWNRALLMILVLVLLLSPTMLVGNSTFVYQCQNNIFTSLGAAGEKLKEIIPAESSIDWRAPNANILLLNFPDAIIYPPQLNGYYSYIQNPDSDLALKNGRWTPQLSRLWFENSDFLILDSQSKLLPDDVQLKDYYQEIEEGIPLYDCGKETFTIRVFKKLP